MEKKQPTMREVALELVGIGVCDNGYLNMVQESLKEIDYGDNDIIANSETNGCFTGSFLNGTVAVP